MREIDEKARQAVLAAFAKGLLPDPTPDELREAVALLREHKMHAVAAYLETVEGSPVGH